MKVPTTTNSCSVDRSNWRRLGVSEELGEPASRVADAYVALGCADSFTCAPYLLDSAPASSEHVAWGEINAVVFANSVLGAKTQKYADYLDACAALTGRAPLAGAHIERDASLDIVCDFVEGENDFWPLLGYVVGLQAGSRIPYVRLEASPSNDDLKAFAAAFGTTSGAPLFHAPWTPRIGLIERPRPSMTLGEDDLAKAWMDLCAGEGDVDLVALGSPHLSLDELEALASCVADKRKHENVRVVATLGGATRRKASSDALKALDAFGVELVEDTCWCMLTEPVVPPSSGRLALTDSAKYAHYAPGLVGRRPRLTSMRSCVASAISGRFSARRPAWLASRRSFAAAAARRVLLLVR